MKDWRGSMLAFFVLISFMTCSSSGNSENKGDSGNTEISSQGAYVTIRGKVNYPQAGQITIQELKEGGTAWNDTITLKKDNTFIKKVKISEPGYYRINFYNTQVLNVILFKNDIEVNVDGNTMTGFSEIKGSPEIDFIRFAQSTIQGVESSPDGVKLNQEFTAAVQQGNQARISQLQQDYQKLMDQAASKVAARINEQPVSLGVINFLQNGGLDKDQYFDVYVTVAESLKKEWAGFNHPKAFIDMVESMKKTAVGQVAPEIALPNPEGQVVKLSSLRGNYVLLDFWAKWCGPCRRENPNVVKAFNKYKDKGFTVFGVSLDRSKEDWLQAIQEDKLTWTHVSDLKYWQSEAAKTYNITGIPFSLLLDKEGKIIAKNLRGPALEEKLAEIFKAN